MKIIFDIHVFILFIYLSFYIYLIHILPFRNELILLINTLCQKRNRVLTLVNDKGFALFSLKIDKT